MKIYARETFFRSITAAEALDFVKNNHSQGSAVPGKNLRAYGLFTFPGELIAVALFCNPRTAGMQKRYTTELFRLAFKKDVTVVGGASKLIKGFLKTSPWDLFTYQDTAGKATNVYELSGMALRGPANPKKKILVKNGLSYPKLMNNREDWFSLEQAITRGPDSLIGSKLGEVFDHEGKRKSNLRLFTEECGYHLEEIPGDRVYEWINPEVKFYLYKITSTAKEGYYYGRHVIRMSDPSLEDCINDGYMGSGGKKFKDWVNHVGEKTLVKTIEKIVPSWEQAIKEEKRLIGDSHLTDPLCKNYQPGGTGLTRMPILVEEVECAVHGETKHVNGICRQCSSQKSWILEKCPVHGLTNFRKDRCEKCAAKKRVTIKLCHIHGETKHQGQTCSKCSTVDVHQAECPIHGFSNFRGDRCLLCVAQKSWVLKACALHGTTLHIGDFCKKCQTDSLVNERECKTHGLTAHLGNACAKCSKTATTMKECVVHGLTKHLGDYCFSCGQARQLTLGLCPVHGEVKLQHGKCTTCSAAEKFSLKNCPSHGESKHIGDKCSKCVAEKAANVQICPIHGSTAHSGKSCRKCISDRGSSLKNCPKHGLVKHRGERCARCSAEKTAHRRFHLKKPNLLCVFCEDEKH